MSKNMRGWFVWFGVGTIEESHEEVRNLTKKEALSIAESMAEKWPRVLIGQVCSNYPHGVERGGIEPWGCWGILAEIREI